MIVCPDCSGEIGERHLFCRHCGRRVGVRCSCGAVRTGEDGFCWQCGRAAHEGRGDVEANAVIPRDNPRRKRAEGPADIVAEAERDGRCFSLGRAKLEQTDIDELFDQEEGA